MSNLHCNVLTPEGQVYEGEATMVVAPASDGQIGIQPRHAALITSLGKGKLRIKTASEGEKEWQLEGGFLEVLNDKLTVLADKVS